MEDQLDEMTARAVDKTPPSSRPLAIEAFQRDAAEIISIYSEDQELKQEKQGRRLAFAAFEAKRKVENEREGRLHTLFYWLFLLSTVVAAPVVALLAHDDFRSVTWDCVGLGSTVLLLSVTYGGYILRMAHGAWGTFAEFVRDIFDITASPSASSTRRTTSSQNTAGFHIALFMIGLLVAAFAGGSLWGVCDELKSHPLDCTAPLQVQSTRVSVASAASPVVSPTPTTEAISSCVASRLHRNGLYCLFVAFVFVLSVLFIMMDGYVATTDKRHSETFDASLSLVFSTIPMAFGIFVMLGFLGSSYLHFRYFEHLNHADAMLQIPVEFMSGALTFQMLLSNGLFVLIKLKMFPKTVIAATKHTVTL